MTLNGALSRTVVAAPVLSCLTGWALSHSSGLYFTSQTYPVRLVAPGAEVLVALSVVLVVVWLFARPRRAATSFSLLTAAALVWLGFSQAVAIRKVDARVWAGPFPFAITQVQVDQAALRLGVCGDKPGFAVWVPVAGEGCRLLYLGPYAKQVGVTVHSILDEPYDP